MWREVVVVTRVTRPWFRLLVSLMLPLWLVGCGGGGGGGGDSGGSAASSSGTSSSTITAPATGFVTARATDATGTQIAAPITIRQPDGSSISGTGQTDSGNWPVGSSFTVTFGDFSAQNFADPNPNPVTVTLTTAGGKLVEGAYQPLPPPP